MEIYNTQLASGIQGLNAPQRSAAAKETLANNVARTPIQDEVRFSDAAQNFAEIARTESSSSGVRFELVNRIKAEIASGVYDTPDKMDIAVDRMMGRIASR